LSASEPESPKPEKTVEQEVSNELGYLKAENEKLRQEDAQTKRQYMELLENSAATIGNLKKELEEARSQLAELQQNPAPAIDLSDKAGEVASYLKTLLCDEKLLNSTLTKIKRNKPVQLPRDVISEVERILGGGDG
jgi:septation ring formation regulator EzrA